MTVNYHTHTPLCRHATGSAREYIETAISRGLTELGFSDHSPMPFANVVHRSGHRMEVDEFPGYVEELLELREEYRAQISLHIGLEVEYYPQLFSDFIRLIAPYPIDYLILGQHFLSNEYDALTPCSAPSDGEERLASYVAQVSEALKTGAFTYLAHPDVLRFTGSDEIFCRHMRPLVRLARDLGIPLEYNLLGLRTNRHYPSDRFFRMAAEEGAAVILASDAHEPSSVARPEDLALAAEKLATLGITPIDKTLLIAPPKII